MTHLYNLPEPFDATVVLNESRYEFSTKARWIHIIAYGGAAGGGGGASGAINTQRGGGAGGQGGLCSWLLIPRVMCPSAIWISPGIGGAGGAADSAGTNGTPTNIFMTDYNGPLLLDVYPGLAGGAGTAASGGQVSNTGTVGRTLGYYFNSSGGDPGTRSGSNGGSTGQPSTVYYSSSELGGSGGAGGAGCPSGSYSAASGGAMIQVQYSRDGYNREFTVGGGFGNATQGGDGVNGYYQQLPATNFNGLIRSYGGTGGGNSNSGTGGRGGNGALAAGGGGGGAGFVGGAGGRGGNGYAIISWW